MNRDSKPPKAPMGDDIIVVQTTQNETDIIYQQNQGRRHIFKLLTQFLREIQAQVEKKINQKNYCNNLNF